MINYIKDLIIVVLYMFGYGDDTELSYTYEEE
jgi:hypothetical protein